MADPQERATVLLELFGLLARLEDQTLADVRRGLALPEGRTQFGDLIREMYRLEPGLRRELLEELEAEQLLILHTG